jgi:hypothetical protein
MSEWVVIFNMSQYSIPLENKTPF